ncbi:hypothetical protein HU200_051172 [Digitaria exilis]|uniref:F-box/LRR-repeat protein 15/At3g58940/PEG3-like LRR domain-containing protein n=1 Tax=Digitaria exilis TaxID=1010633 RepID=A0A835E8I0_9POAL|nr:hypothetical protein HU200_051172 [Digitaria exilis]
MRFGKGRESSGSRRCGSDLKRSKSGPVGVKPTMMLIRSYGKYQEKYLRSKRDKVGLLATENSRVYFNVPSFSPTLRVLSLCCRSNRIGFRAEEAAALGFPHLEQLTLKGPQSTLDGILSGCPALQSLVLHGNVGYSQLRISSRTLRRLGLSGGSHELQGEVHIQDAPLLERLFQDGPVYRDKIRVIKAPKLKMLGYLPAGSTSKEFCSPKLNFRGSCSHLVQCMLTTT